MTPSLMAALKPVLELLQREVPRLPRSVEKRREAKVRRRSVIKDGPAAAGRLRVKTVAATAIAPAVPDKCGKPGVPPRPVIEFPVAIWEHWDEPDTFNEALALHMKRHGDTCWHLYRAVVREKEVFDRKTLYSWRAGTRVPRGTESLKVLTRIERRYRLPAGYFSSKLICRPRAITGFRLPGINATEQRRLVWHLPMTLTTGRYLSVKKSLIGCAVSL